MLRKIFFCILLVLISIIIVSFLIQQNSNRPASIIKQLRLQDESSIEERKLVFKVSFLGFIPVGYAELENRGTLFFRGREVLHLSAKAIASEFISSFYDVKAKVDSCIDEDKLHSLRFSETLILPNKPKEIKEVFYDQKKNVMELEGVRRKILPDTQDPLSAMFYIRHQSLEIGKEFDININTNQKNYRLFVKVIKDEEYKIKDKKAKVWVLTGDIRRRDKSPRHSSTMTLWILDNPSKTPLLIKVTAGIFPFTARLIDLK